MRSAAVPVLVALATVAAGPQPAQKGRREPDPSQTLTAPYIAPAPPTAAPERPYLFLLGSLPVRLWAPVPPPYNSRANGNFAARPIWWDSAAAW